MLKKGHYNSEGLINDKKKGQVLYASINSGNGIF